MAYIPIASKDISHLRENKNDLEREVGDRENLSLSGVILTVPSVKNVCLLSRFDF